MKSLMEMLKTTVERVPGDEAVADMSKRLTYSELWNQVTSLATALRQLGVSPGDRVGVLLQNSVEFVVGLYATYAAGAVAVPIDADARLPTLTYQLGGTGAVALLTQAYYTELVREALKKIPSVRAAIVCSDRMSSPSLSNLGIAVEDWGKAVTGRADTPFFSSPHDNAQILHTTGTSGVAKGVLLTHRQMLLATQNIVKMAEITDVDREVTALPLVRLFGQFHIYCYHQVGGTLIIESELSRLRSPDRLLDRVLAERATSFPHVPSTFIMLMRHHGDKLRECDCSLRYVMLCSMPIRVEDLRRLQDHLPNTQIINTYGLSEAVRSTYVNVTRQPEKAASVGRPVAGGKVIIADDQGNELPANATGQIVLQMPHAFSGYWNNPEETAQVLHKDKLYTGDIGYLDEDGFLYYVGRIKDTINVGGRKFHPREVEEILNELDNVQQAVLVPVPDPRGVLGEVPFAFIVPAKEQAPTDRELRQALLGKVENYKIPRVFSFTDSLPRTGSGKVLGRSLREEAVRLLSGYPGDNNECC